MAAKENSQTGPSIPWEKYRLTNGLQVILAVDRRVPSVHLNLSYHVGAKNEEPGRTGLAHLVEHMMFERSQNASAGYGSMIEKAGGITNGTTDEDRTSFFETVPSGALEYTLWLESDRLSTLSKTVNCERLENQKAVIANELRQAHDGVPFGIFTEVLLKNLFPRGHPYGHPTGGLPEDVRNVSIEEVKDFLSKYYVPNNLSLVVVGNFDASMTKQWIARYFGPISPAPPITRPARWQPWLSGERVIDLDDHIAQDRVYFAWVGPSFSSIEQTRLDLAARILSRRLNAALVYNEAPACSEVSVQNLVREDASVFLVMANVHEDQYLHAVEQSVENVITTLSSEIPGEIELKSAKSRARYEELSQFDTLESIADTLNRSNVLTGEPDHYTLIWKKIEAASRDDVTSAVAEFLDIKTCLRIRFHPKTAQAEGTSRLDRSVQPAIHPDPPLQAPQVVSGKLPNGLEVFVSQRPVSPKVSVLFVTRAGVMLDSEEKNGLAKMVAVTVGNGTESRTASLIRDQMELAGATTIEPSIGTEAVLLGFEVLSPGLKSAVEILADAVLHPVFKQFSFDINRHRLQAVLAQSRFDIEETAGAAASALVFGQGHPYARPSATFSGLSSLRRDDLQEFYQTYWKPNRSAIIFSGDVSTDLAFSLAHTYFAGWSGNSIPAPPVPAPHPAASNRIYLIDRPNATQTLIIQMLPAVSADSSERFPLMLANRVWGAMWGSRLSKSIREELGSTYAFVADLSFFSSCGIWLACGAVQIDKTKQSLIELDRQLDLLRTQPISEREFRDAKGTQARCAVSSFERSAGIASLIAQSWTWRLRAPDFQREVDRMEQTSLEEVRAAISQYAVRQNVIFLLLGDRRHIEEPLRELNFGPVIPIDALGRPLFDSDR